MKLDTALVANLNKKQEKELDNVVDLKLVGGGTTDGDWLSKLEPGTVFLVKDKKNYNNWELSLFKLVDKTPASAILQTPKVPTSVYVVPGLFCKDFNLHETIGVIEYQPEAVVEEQQPSENEDGSNRVQGDTPGETPKLDGHDQ